MWLWTADCALHIFSSKLCLTCRRHMHLFEYIPLVSFGDVAFAVLEHTHTHWHCQCSNSRSRNTVTERKSTAEFQQTAMRCCLCACVSVIIIIIINSNWLCKRQMECNSFASTGCHSRFAKCVRCQWWFSRQQTHHRPIFFGEIRHMSIHIRWHKMSPDWQWRIRSWWGFRRMLHQSGHDLHHDHQFFSLIMKQFNSRFASHSPSQMHSFKFVAKHEIAFWCLICAPDGIGGRARCPWRFPGRGQTIRHRRPMH